MGRSAASGPPAGPRERPGRGGLPPGRRQQDLDLPPGRRDVREDPGPAASAHVGRPEEPGRARTSPGAPAPAGAAARNAVRSSWRRPAVVPDIARPAPDTPSRRDSAVRCGAAALDGAGGQPRRGSPRYVPKYQWLPSGSRAAKSREP
ncbi:hypothetical protein GCM10025734_22830 [Kitasatospora paranensis]